MTVPRPRPARPILAAVGDLVEDIVVSVHDPLALASDTEATIVRRRGGSAANVCAAAARLDHRPTRFIGQIGDDPPGRMLADLLAADGVELAVHRRGRTGTVVVLVDHTGERTMLPDPAASAELSDPRPEWLDGVGMLHLSAYALVRQPVASAAMELAMWARQRSVPISIDASSAALIESYGVDRFSEMLRTIGPEVLLVNELEAATLGDQRLAAIGAPITVTKHGSRPAKLTTAAGTVDIPARPMVVRDSTAAGDSFAAGVLGALLDGLTPADAVAHGHRIAAAVIGGESR